MTNEAIVISGEENVKAYRTLAQVHFWRLQAQMKTKYNIPPRKGWTIRTFNEMYDLKAKSWADIAILADSMIQTLRGES